MTTTCGDLGDRLAAAVTDGGALDRAARAHVETCLRCQADLVEHRRVLRALRSLRTEVLVPAPGLVTEVLAHIEEAGERRAIRSLLTRAAGRLPRGPGRGHRGGRGGRGDRPGHPHPGPAPAPGRLTGGRALQPSGSGGGGVASVAWACPRLDRGILTTEGSSSTGRAPVSKTGGWGFDSLLPCAPHPPPLVRDLRWR